MKKENREFKSIDVMGGSQGSSNAKCTGYDSKKGYAKDQRHMPCSGMNYFGCKGGGEF